MSPICRYSFYLVVLAALGANGVVMLGRRFGQFGSVERNADSPKAEQPPYETMANLVKPYGYQLEEHFVNTYDGYILRLFRLGPRSNSRATDVDDDDDDDDVIEDVQRAISETSQSSGVNNGSQSPFEGPGQPRPVVFMQHPLMGSSVDYVVTGPQRSLGFILVDAGYDVWLTNVRGNRFSRNHTRLNPDDPTDKAAFWAYSWDEHVALDLPAAVDFVAAATGQERMLYVGYSQGTTMGLAALASQPRVTQRVSAAVLLAPVAFATHITSTIFRLMSTWRLEELLRRVGMHEYAGHSPAASELAATFCGRYPWPCQQYLYQLCGANPYGNLDPDLLPDIMRYLPSGTSVQNMAHWGQLVRSADPTRLSYYDYGTNCSASNDDDRTSGGAISPGGLPASTTTAAVVAPTGGQFPCNQAAYNATAPPSYDLRAITTPLALFTGGHDALSDPVDVQLLIQALGGYHPDPSGPGFGIDEPDQYDKPEVAGSAESAGFAKFGSGSGGATAGVVRLHHFEPNYGHLDFGVGHDAPDRIYPLVLEFMRAYTPAQQNAAE